MVVDLKALLNDVKNEKISIEDAQAQISVPRGRSATPTGTVEYDVKVWKAVKIDDGWNDTEVVLVRKSHDINDVKKVIKVDIEKMIKEEESKPKKPKKQKKVEEPEEQNDEPEEEEG